MTLGAPAGLTLLVALLTAPASLAAPNRRNAAILPAALVTFDPHSSATGRSQFEGAESWSVKALRQ